jgi:hypothetical protein
VESCQWKFWVKESLFKAFKFWKNSSFKEESMELGLAGYGKWRRKAIKNDKIKV